MGKSESGKLFGWCSPELMVDQHDKCKVSFTFYEQEIKCGCLCHSNREEFLDAQQTTATKRPRNKRTTKPPVASDKPTSTPSVEVTETRKRRRKTTATTNQEGE